MNTFIKKGLCALIAVAILSGGMFAYPKQSVAQYPVIEVGANLFQNTVSAVNNLAEKIKDYALDGLAYQLAKAAISSITNSIVNWINSGFQGSPAFVTDLHSLLRDVGDQVFSDFISQLDSGTQSLLCSPFALDVKIALTVNHFKNDVEENRCGIETVLGNAQNLQNFLGGNFSQGGWKGWFDLTTKSQNNPYGSFISAESALQARIGKSQAVLKEELSWGNGFLSSKDCATVGENQRYIDVVNTVGGRNPGVPITQEGNTICAIKTPGKVIEQQLEHVLGSGIRQLELADELNEIINALVAQLTNQVITGASGLLGTSNPSATTGGGINAQSFLDQLVANSQQQTQNAAATGVASQVETVSTQEQNYQAFKQQSYDSVLTAEAALTPLASCPAAAIFVATSQASINNLKNSLQNDLTASQTALAALQNLDTQAQNATTQAQITAVTNQLQTLQTNGTVHTQQQMIAASNQTSAVGTQMNQITTQANSLATTCTP